MPRFLALLLVLMSLAGCSAPASSGGSRYIATETPVTYAVTYRLTGHYGGGAKAAITYNDRLGKTQKATGRLPWEQKFTAASGVFLYVSVQNPDNYGDVACEIIIDGVKAKSESASGGRKIVTCSGKL